MVGKPCKKCKTGVYNKVGSFRDAVEDGKYRTGDRYVCSVCKNEWRDVKEETDV